MASSVIREVFVNWMSSFGANSPKSKEDNILLKELRILVVDDDDLNQRLLGMILSKGNHQITVSYDGYDALKTLERDIFDLVFLDITIPRVNGFEVCEHIRKGDFPNTKTPIVALTALHARDTHLQDFLDRGMFNECIHKPFDRKQILKVVSAASEKTEFDVVLSEKSVSADNALVLNFEKALPIFDDIGAYKKMFKDFLDGMPKRLEDIQSSREAGDWKELAVLAHNLTGVTRNFGAEKLSMLSEELDNASSTQKLESIDRIIKGIEKQLPALQEAYSALS